MSKLYMIVVIASASVLLMFLAALLMLVITVPENEWMERMQSEADPLNVPVRLCSPDFGCKSVIKDPTRDRALEMAFEGLRASAKLGQCDWGIWKKAKWGRFVWKELFEREGSERDLPDGIELKPAVCEALANGEWRFRELYDYGDNEMVAVWKKYHPESGFGGALVMYARRPALGQPYEVTSWSTYANLYMGLEELRKLVHP